MRSEQISIKHYYLIMKTKFYGNRLNRKTNGPIKRKGRKNYSFL